MDGEPNSRPRWPLIIAGIVGLVVGIVLIATACGVVLSTTVAGDPSLNAPAGRMASLEGQVYSINIPRAVPSKPGTFVSVIIRFMYSVVRGKRAAVILETRTADRGRGAGPALPRSGSDLVVEGEFARDGVFVVNSFKQVGGVQGRAASPLAKGQ